MKRMKVLFGNRRMMVLLTLAILVLAAAALVASSASFTATSANPTTRVQHRRPQASATVLDDGHR